MLLHPGPTQLNRGNGVLCLCYLQLRYHLSKRSVKRSSCRKGKLYFQRNVIYLQKYIKKMSYSSYTQKNVSLIVVGESNSIFLMSLQMCESNS